MPSTSHGRRMFLQAGLASVALSSTAMSLALAGPVGIYDEQADASADLAAALDSANRQGKLVLVVFGANWCPDCRALDGMAHNGELKQVLDDGYVVVHVDVGRFNKNLDLADKYVVNLKEGIPCAAVLAANGAPAVADLVYGRAMERLMKGGNSTLAAYFDEVSSRFKPVR